MPRGDNHTGTGQRHNKHVFINVILYIACSSSRVLVAVIRRMMNIFIYVKPGFKIRAQQQYVYLVVFYLVLVPKYYSLAACIVRTHCTQCYNNNIMCTHVDGGGSMTFFKKKFNFFRHRLCCGSIKFPRTKKSSIRVKPDNSLSSGANATAPRPTSTYQYLGI